MHHSTCPLCKSDAISLFVHATDHTVSHEAFGIWKCSNCTGMFTQDAPGEDAIGKYYQSSSYISHSDTKEGLINRLYHAVRKITLTGKRKLVCRFAQTRSGAILDIGCGTGAFLSEMKGAGWQITGLEPDSTARKNAEKLYGIKPHPSPQLFALQPSQFDAITMWHVIEHVHPVHEYFGKMFDLLKDDGVLMIAVPNFTSSDAAKYKSYWAAYDVPRHLYHFSPESMKRIVSLHHLKVHAIKPMWFDSFYVSMLSEKYRNGKGNFIGAVVAGLLSNLSALFNPDRCSSLIYIIKKDGARN